MRRRDIIAGAAAAIISRKAHGARGGIALTAQAFSTIILDNFTFVPDGISVQDVGNVVVTMNPASPASTATISLGGTDAAKFQLTNSGVLPCKVQAKSTTGTGIYAITLTGTQGGAANSPFTTSPITLTGVSAGAGTSVTFANTSGSASPAATPITCPQWFPEALVPSGSIAVPQIGGIDAFYQVDNLTYWGDGSLLGGVFRIISGAISGNATTKITFDIRSGSYTHTSAITTASVTSETDYNIAIRKCHTAYIPMSSANNVAAAVQINAGTGQISGATVFFPSNLTLATKNISNGNGSGGQISFASGTPTIVAAGSGYSYVGAGTGAFTNSFNTGIGIVNGSGNNVGAYLTQYAKGPACDAWRLRLPTPSLPHHHVTYYVERWKKTDGTLLGYYAYASLGNGLSDTSNTLYCYTYDTDWKNGSTVIRGDTNGDLGWTNQVHYMAANWSTFDAAALGDWTANDAAFKAIVQQRAPTECDELKATGLAPWLAITPTLTVPTTPATYELSLNGGMGFFCNYQPLGSAGCRCPSGSAGVGNTENPLGVGIAATYWQSLRSSTAGASTWIRNMRVGAAHGMGSSQHGAAMFDKTNLFYPCVIPAATQTFSGMTQSSTLSSISLTEKGICNPIIDAQSTVNSGVNTYHQAGYAIMPYLIEGQQWMLDAMMNAAATVLYGIDYAYSRSAVLGSTTYYGVLTNKEGNVRVQAWNKRTQGYAAKFSPTTWSDGAANVEQSYIQYCLKNQFDYLFALVSFIGSVKFGPSTTASNKTKDFSGTGVWPEAFSVASAYSHEVTVPFMDDYEMQVCALLAYLWKGTATGTSIATWRDYFKNYYVKLWAYAGSHYLNDSYRINAFAAAPPSDPADPTWSSEGNATTPKLAFAPGNNSQMTFVATNSTVTLNASIFVDHASTVRAANGSRIKLTNTNIASYGVTPGALPPEIDPTAWYYWKEITATSGQLCTDVGLTLPVTPSTSIGGKYFWVVPSNTLPTDTSGQGTYNGGTSNSGNSRIAAKLGTMRLCQAMGMADDANGNVTDAITNCAAIFNSVPGQAGYSADAQYGWDNVL